MDRSQFLEIDHQQKLDLRSRHQVAQWLRTHELQADDPDWLGDLLHPKNIDPYP